MEGEGECSLDVNFSYWVLIFLNRKWNYGNFNNLTGKCRENTQHRVHDT